MNGEVTHVRCLIPEHEHINGPVTRGLIRRTLKWLAAIWAVGAVPLVLDAPRPLKAAGLGLMVPGGGYVYARAPFRAAGSLGGSFLAFVLFFSTGNAAALPLVWLGTAAGAAARVRKAAS